MLEQEGQNIKLDGQCVAMGALFHGTGFITLARPPEVGANTLLRWLSAGSLEKVTQSTHPPAGRTVDGP